MKACNKFSLIYHHFYLPNVKKRQSAVAMKHVHSEHLGCSFISRIRWRSLFISKKLFAQFNLIGFFNWTVMQQDCILRSWQRLNFGPWEKQSISFASGRRKPLKTNTSGPPHEFEANLELSTGQIFQSCIKNAINKLICCVDGTKLILVLTFGSLQQLSALQYFISVSSVNSFGSDLKTKQKSPSTPLNVDTNAKYTRKSLFFK